MDELSNFVADESAEAADSETSSTIPRKRQHLDDEEEGEEAADGENEEREEGEDGEEEGKETGQSEEDGEGKTYKCLETDCSMAFPYNWALKVHLRSHGINASTKCPHCSFSTVFEGVFSWHMKCHAQTQGQRNEKKDVECLPKRYLNLCQSEKKVLQCHLCPAAFEEKRILKAHKAMCHRVQFPCPCCPQQFPFPFELAQHLSTHAVTSPMFSCRMCECAFSLHGQLSTHMLAHRDSVAYNYKCQECEMKFVHRVGLNMHSKEHRGELTHCQHCTAVFCERDHYQCHLKKKHSEK